MDNAQIPFWFLNDKLENKELQRQLELMRSKGVIHCVPHGRSGFIGEYLSDEWFNHIQMILDDKREHGEAVWLYDEFNWPAGTCNRTITKDENLREQYLDIHKVEVKAGERYRYLRQSTCLTISAFEKDGTGPIDLDAYKVGWFGIEYRPQRDMDIYEVNVCIDPYLGAGSGSVNYLDKKATQAFIDSTYEKYYDHFKEDFGPLIKAFFNDESRLCNAFPWCDDFARVFKELKGYDIIPYLGYLIQSGETAGRVRCDYFDVVAHLYQNNYLRVLGEWCEAHRIGLSAHLLNEETLAGQVRYNGDYLRQLKYMTFPGVDHLGKGIGSLNIKYGSSAAHNYGKTNLHCEVFAGCGWDMTVEEGIRITSWLFQQGVQIIINHAFFYSIRDERANDWPPSQFFQWKDWKKMDVYNAMVRRLHYCLSGGCHEAETLIYNPVESFWFHYLADQRFKHGYLNYGPRIESERAAFIDSELQKLMTGLQDLNLDFDIINADALENFEVKQGELVNKLNGEHFKVFILPMVEVVPLKIMETLQEFAVQGGKVIALDCLPKYAMAKLDDTRLATIVTTMQTQGQLILMPIGRTAELAGIINELAPEPIEILKGVAGTRHSLSTYGDEIIDPYLHTGEDLSGVAYSRYIKDNCRIFYFVNYNQQVEQLTVRVESATIPEIWDSVTGEISEAEVVEQTADTYILALNLPPGYGVMLVTPMKNR